MDVKSAIENRRSIRKFKDLEIDPDVLLELIDSARHSPSSGNLQPWKFILVKDQKKKNDIADACFQQMWMASAPVLLCITSMDDDVNRMYGVKGKQYCIQNCAIAAQTIMLRAEELELGTCFVSAFEEGMMRRILELPEEVSPQIVIAVGHGNDVPNEKLMKSLESMTYFEGHGGRTEDFDEAFYNWSGIMEKKAKAILGKFKSGYGGLKDRIHQKFKEE